MIFKSKLTNIRYFELWVSSLNEERFTLADSSKANIEILRFEVITYNLDIEKSFALIEFNSIQSAWEFYEKNLDIYYWDA